MPKSNRILVVALLMTAGGYVTPGVSQTTTDQTMPRDDDDDGFDNWGLLGLLGLAGLLGRKRDRDVVETRRV